MTFKDKLIKACLLSIMVFLIVFGLAVLGASFLPFEFIKSKIDALAYDGSVDPFTQPLFKQIAIRLRYVAIAMLLAVGIFYRVRHKVHRHVSNTLTSLHFLSKEIGQRFTEAVRKDDKIHRYALFSILLLTVVVRLFFLFRPMGYDEAWTFEAYASKPLVVGLSNYSGPNNHLFHTLLVHMAYVLLGNQPWVIRLPALFAGILVVPAAYIVTRVFYNKHAALLSAGFVASSCSLILYSTDARGYTLICLIFLLLLALATYVKQSLNPAVWFLFAILSALGFYTIPIMLYPFGIVVAWVFLSVIFEKTHLSRSMVLRNLFISSTIVAVLTFVLYSPVFVVSGFESVTANRFVYAQSWSGFTAQFPGFARSVWDEWNAYIPALIRFSLVAGFFASLVLHKRITTYRIPIILAVIVSTASILTIHPVVRFTRVWLFLLPVYIILASSGLNDLLGLAISKMSHYKSGMLSVLALILSLSLTLSVLSARSRYYSDTKWAPAAAEPITIFLKDYLKPGDAVLTASLLDVPLAYYFHVHGVPVQYLSSNLNSTGRILAVVCDSAHQTLKGLFDRKGLSESNLSVPKLVKRYHGATLYELSWLNGNHQRPAGKPQDVRTMSYGDRPVQLESKNSQRSPQVFGES